MTNTLAAALAGILLATTSPTPQSNLQAIERLAERQQAMPVVYFQPVETATPPKVARSTPVATPQQRPDTTLQMTPQEIAYERARPWMLIQRPWRGAVRVRGGWLIHESSDYTGFYRSVTDGESRRLRNSR